jgi:replicative DNA helicase
MVVDTLSTRIEKNTISIEDLFGFYGIENKDKLQMFPMVDTLMVETPYNGLQKITHLIQKPKSDVYEVVTSSGRKVHVADRHIFETHDNQGVFCNELKVGDYINTKSGMEQVTKCEYYTNDYVYDISIAAPHWFYDSEGFVHHNSIALTHTASVGISNKKNVLFITLEMPEEDIEKRIDANLLGLTTEELETIDIEDIRTKFDNIKGDLGELRVKEYGSGEFNTIKMKTILNDLYNEDKFRPDMIVIDYITLMSSSRGSLQSIGNTNTYYRYVSEELLTASKKLINSNGKVGVAIVSAAQLNRNGYGNVDAGMQDISEAISIMQTANNSIFLITNEEMKKQGIMLWKWVKNRNRGKLETLTVNIDYPRMTFSDFDQQKLSSGQQDNLKNVINNDDFSMENDIDTSALKF